MKKATEPKYATLGVKWLSPYMNLHTATQEKKDEAYEYMAIRSVPGPFLIISFFLLFVYISPIYKDQPTEIYFIGIALILIGIFRAINEIGFKKFYPTNKKRWSFAYFTGISLTAFVWGIFCLIIVAEYGINWISLLVLVCTAGLSAAGIIAVIPHRLLSFTFQAFILLPTAIFSFTLDTAAAYSISYMFLSYLVFMSFMSLNLNKEYWVSVENVILLDERAKELEISRDNAIQLADAKTTFLTTMSHELRTPMNGILGMTQLLKMGELDKEQMEYIDTIKSSTDVLLRIINDILIHSKMESGKLTIEHHHFDISLLLDNIYRLLKPVTDEKKIDFIINIPANCPTDLIGDEGKIRQILLNLSGNAIKFTKHGSVSISITCSGDDQSRQFRFAVTDTGIGIDPSKHAVIFSDFTQADNSTTREYGGTGLGLTISKQLVTLLGGEIGVQSKVNEGSIFWFEIPLTSAGISANTTNAIDPKENESKGETDSSTATAPDFLLNELVQSQLKEMMGDQYPQLIESHITATSETITHIQQHIKAENMQKLLPYLNSLKSSSASIGAKALEAEINFMEKNITNNIIPNHNEYQKVIRLFNETTEALEKQLRLSKSE